MKKLILENMLEDDMDIHYCYHRGLDSFLGEHGHDFFEFFIITLGSLIHNINGEMRKLSAGHLVLITENDFHCYKKIKNANCEYVNIAFSRNTLYKYAQLLVNRKQIDDLIKKGNNEIFVDNKFFRQFAETYSIINDTIDANLKTDLRLKSLLVSLIAYWIEKSNMDISGGNIPKYISKLHSDMHDPSNFTSSLFNIFSKSNYSYEHCCRKIKEHYDQTPVKILNEAKLNYARYLLVVSDESILDISSACGYDSLAYFYKLFNEKFHSTPNKYRAEKKHQMV